VNDLDLKVAEEVVADINSKGGTSMAVAGSVTDELFPDQLMAQTVEEFGALDILVNNAGFLWYGMLHKMSDAQWQAIVDCHGTAPFRMIRAAAPYMRDAAKKELDAGIPIQDRVVLNVSSTSGLHGNVGQANYSFCKMGMVGLTKTVAKEWGHLGIRCNAVAYGMIGTRMTGAFEGESVEVAGKEISQGMPKGVADAWDNPEYVSSLVPLGRKGTPEEAAGGLLMLASPYARYVTGHTLEVTGGFQI
jgi:3-oxoacyl-[acyl-carrier protein] reductase